MSPQILLGGKQMSERSLGQNVTNIGSGGWSGGYGAGVRVSIGQQSITVVNPAGSVVLGTVEMSCYTAAVGSVIQGSLSVDGAAQVVWGVYAFNVANDHEQFRWGWSASVGPGTHTFNHGIWVAAGNVYFDGNDGGTFTAWERI